MELSDIKKVGVVGAGRMGFGIALNFALWGYPTLMSDLSAEILERSMHNVKSALALFVEEGLIIPQQAEETLTRITTTTNLAELAAASDFVTEVIVDRSQDKRALFNQLDKLCPPQTILASNRGRLTTKTQRYKVS